MTARLHSLALVVGLVLAPAVTLTAATALAQDGMRSVDPAAEAPRADVLVLSDGRRLVGEILAEADGLVTFRSAGVTRAYPRDRVRSVEKGAATAPDARPAEDSARTSASPPPARATDKAAKKPVRAAAGPLSEPARAWLATLVARSTDADPQVQRSLAAAMHALGPAAVEPLRAAASGADGGTRLFLERVARSIEDGAKRKRRRSDAPRSDSAGPRDLRGDRAAQMRTALVEELSVTPDQRGAFDGALDAAQRRQLEIGRAVRAGTLERTAAREQLATVRTDLLATLKGVLDPAQYALYEQMSAGYFEKMAQKLQQQKKPGKAPQ